MKYHFRYCLTLLALCMAAATCVSCDDEDDDYIAKQLRSSDWEGYIGTYYTNRWNLTGNEFATVMHFESRSSYYTSGRGAELDYDTRSAYEDYAYCTFKWFIVDGDITLIYDDQKWQPIYIVDYRLNSSNFWGYIYDGSSTRIQFDLQSTNYTDWSDYSRYGTGSYGDFRNQNYYRSRTAAGDGGAPLPRVAGENGVPFIDRTPYLRADDGEQPVCVMSGKFAEAYQNMQ